MCSENIRERNLKSQDTVVFPNSWADLFLFLIRKDSGDIDLVLSYLKLLRKELIYLCQELQFVWEKCADRSLRNWAQKALA